MSKPTFAVLCLVFICALGLHAPATYAGVAIGEECDPHYADKICAAGLICRNKTCQYESDKVAEDLQRCKNKLLENGSNGRAALNENFCYDGEACPDLYNRIAELSKFSDMTEEMTGASGTSGVGESFTYKTGAAAQRDLLLKATAKACNQCTSGGKPRCFYPATSVLY